MSINTKSGLHKVLIKPVLTNGAETRTIDKIDKISVNFSKKEIKENL